MEVISGESVAQAIEYYASFVKDLHTDKDVRQLFLNIFAIAVYYKLGMQKAFLA